MKLKALFVFVLLLITGVSHAATTPTVSGLWPGSGGSGTIIFVFGSDFNPTFGATKVSVGGVSAPIMQVMDSTLLFFMVPPGNPTGPVSVTTSLGSGTSGIDFGAPPSGLAITGMWPGTAKVGDIVFVFGSSYIAGTSKTTATVNDVQAPILQVLDSSMLFFMVPSGATSGPVTAATTSPIASTTSSSYLRILPDGYEGTWIRPRESAIPKTPEGDMIRYGKELLTKTAYYFNTLGVVPGYSTGNDLNCTNCHLDDGTRAYSSPWAVVYYKYSGTGQYAARSGKYLTNEGRIQGCLKRSMNAQTQTLPETGYEMQSMVAYYKWLATGMQVADWTLVKGQGFIAVTDLTRAADPVRGQIVYEMNCARCHGTDGLGKGNYPPLWGSRSFNDGAGMFRPRTGVRFIKGNMPYGRAVPTDPTTQLSTEDAWDVTSYIMYQSRPVFYNLVNDWSCTHVGPDGVPDWMRKAPDAGYAVYYPRWDGAHYGCDTTYPQVFPEIKHKYGPWQDMLSLQTNIINDFKVCGRSPCP